MHLLDQLSLTAYLFQVISGDFQKDRLLAITRTQFAHKSPSKYQANALPENLTKMSQVSGIMEEKDVLKGKPTLVRRVSDMFKGKQAAISRSPSYRKSRLRCLNEIYILTN